MKRIIIILMTLTACNLAYADIFEYKTTKNKVRYVFHSHNESAYQHAYCSLHKSIEEFELPDKTRVDCLTNEYAIEFDFAEKKYESVGQALHYASSTGKKAKVVLILDKKFEKEQIKYYERIKKAGKIYNYEVEYITEDILNLDSNGHYPYIDCKCNKKD